MGPELIEEATYQWSPRLSVGDEAIDRQHQEFFARIKAFMVGSETARWEELDELHGFLRDYALRHFKEEEDLMAAVGYPNRAAHMRMHDHFRESLADCMERYAADEEPNRATLKCLGLLLGRWLVEHVGRVDLELSFFLQGRERSA